MTPSAGLQSPGPTSGLLGSGQREAGPCWWKGGSGSEFSAVMTSALSGHMPVTCSGYTQLSHRGHPHRHLFGGASAVNRFLNIAPGGVARWRSCLLQAGQGCSGDPSTYHQRESQGWSPRPGPRSRGCFAQGQPALGSIQPGYLGPMSWLDLGLVLTSSSFQLCFLSPLCGPWGSMSLHSSPMGYSHPAGLTVGVFMSYDLPGAVWAFSH